MQNCAEYGEITMKFASKNDNFSSKCVKEDTHGASLYGEIYAACRSLEEHEWIELVCNSAERPWARGAQLPGFPDPALQISMVGAAGEAGLREVARLYLTVHEEARKWGVVFDENTRILDFGCGFGRLLRFFMKDAAPGNLIGTDVDDSFIRLCKELFQGGVFDVNAPFPPLGYADASFDIIYAYSAFTHLSEAAHLAWLLEYKRILKPGGLLFLTVRQRSFLNYCVALRNKPEASDYDKVMGDFLGMRKKCCRAMKRASTYFFPAAALCAPATFTGIPSFRPGILSKSGGSIFPSLPQTMMLIRRLWCCGIKLLLNTRHSRVPCWAGCWL